MNTLLSPFRLADTSLANRVVMAPMTRSRAIDGHPDAQTARYYAQRASAGLMISEGLPVSAQAVGYLHTPGIYLPSQVAAWRQVTDAVHAKGGRIFAQLWHVGRVSHHSLQPGGQAPVSAVAVAGGSAYAFDSNGQPATVPASSPVALDEKGIGAVIQEFRQAAANAMAAGFDGVELHGANGYLIEQFINPLLNTRSDRYGGQSLQSRSRLLLEIVAQIAEEIGAGRLGVRLSPFNTLQDMPPYPQTLETYAFISEMLNEYRLAYVHLACQGAVLSSGLLAEVRRRWQGPLILAGGLTPEQADNLIAEGITDLAAFGTPFIANPDFVERIRHQWPLAMVDRASFYGGGAKGYTDYPPYQPQGAAPATS